MQIVIGRKPPALRRCLPLRKVQSIYISLQCRCGLAAPGLREVELKVFGMQRALKQVILVFKLLLWKSCWTSTFRMGESSSCFSVPQFWKSLSPSPPHPSSCLIIWKSNESYILLPSCLIFVMGFPPFWIFSWHHSGFPDQAEVATIGWRIFNCLLKK